MTIKKFVVVLEKVTEHEYTVEASDKDNARIQALLLHQDGEQGRTYNMVPTVSSVEYLH